MNKFIKRLLKKLPENESIPVDFPFSNKKLLKPKGMTDEECRSLPIFTDNLTCLSCWRVDIWGRIRVLLTGNIWIWVWSGQTQPPICVDTRVLKKVTLDSGSSSE